MTSHQIGFELYFRGKPPRLVIWCAPGFKVQTASLIRSCNPSERAHFANVNELIKRLAGGERLSQDSFRKEDVGYAFKSGPVRLYGAFSRRHSASFVLSHSILKRQPKLEAGDLRRIKACLADFDRLPTLPDIHT